MIAIDTNVLVRILLDDPDQIEQIKSARKLAEKHKVLFVPQLVLAELVWVLDFSYELSKAEIIFMLKHLQENEAFFLEYEARFVSALCMYQTSNVSFSDCLIWQAVREKKIELVTFDKNFSKLPEVSHLN